MGNACMLEIYLMKILMDEVDYKTDSKGQNKVKMVKYFLKKDKTKK